MWVVSEHHVLEDRDGELGAGGLGLPVEQLGLQVEVCLTSRQKIALGSHRPVLVELVLPLLAVPGKPAVAGLFEAGPRGPRG